MKLWLTLRNEQSGTTEGGRGGRSRTTTTTGKEPKQGEPGVYRWSEIHDGPPTAKSEANLIGLRDICNLETDTQTEASRSTIRQKWEKWVLYRTQNEDIGLEQ